ncbi:MAG TPA: hypothetical protein VGE07_09320 [Herpetosiphonaceae bacterium]
MFYLQATPAQAPDLICVLACLGGSLLVVRSADRTTLAADLQAQIQAAEVNRRGQFRVLHSDELWVATIDALEQDVNVAGYNDAVTLYGRMHAVVRGRTPTIQALATDVRMMVGRLDLLYGWRIGLAAPFQHPVRGDEVLLHALIPVAPCVTIEQRRGLTLLYPLLDPSRVQNLDNRPLTLGIIYDLLAQLQHDLASVQPDHRLARLVIPVPSRQQLEADLQNDGYAIRGDVAVRQSAAAGGSAPTSLLGRMRQWAATWSAASIPLPPQATLPLYSQLIDDVLQAITTPPDLAMIAALRQCLLPSTAPAAAPSPGPRAPAPATTGRRSPPSPQRPQATAGGWAADFTRAPVPPPPTAPWWQDFERAAHPQSTITTTTDWSPPGPAADGPAAEGPVAWRQDFDAPPAPAPPAAEPDDWARDFD